MTWIRTFHLGMIYCLLISVIVNAIVGFVLSCININNYRTAIVSGSTMKEGMTPSSRIDLSHNYSKIGSDYPRSRRVKFDESALKKIHKPPTPYGDDPRKAGNKTDVSRGGLPYPIPEMKRQANMSQLDKAKLKGDYQTTNEDLGRSDIVPFGSSARFAGIHQDLSPLVGITSAK